MYKLNVNWQAFEDAEDYLTEGGTKDFEEHAFAILWHWVRPALLSIEQGLETEEDFLYYKKCVKHGLYDLGATNAYKHIYNNWKDPEAI